MSSAITIRYVEDSHSLLTSTYGFSCEASGNSLTLHAPTELGLGYFKSISLGDDLVLGITRLNLKRPIVMHYENYDNQFETTYCVSGHIGYAETGVVETGLKKNEYGIYLKQHSRGMVLYPSCEDIFAVSILAKGTLLESLPYFDDCTSEKQTLHTHLVHHLISPQKSDLPLHSMFLKTTRSDLDGALQILLQEGLAKTLVASLWDNCVVRPIEGRGSCPFGETDRRAFMKTADILTQRYENPPTIPELSRMVGINEHKLKIGFRAMHGKTIYEYAHDQRMKAARVLLEDNDLTVSQVAYSVGYINVSHFSQAFYKQYGANPSDLRKRG